MNEKRPAPESDVRGLFARRPDGSLYRRGAFVNYSISVGPALQQNEMVQAGAARVSDSLQNIVWDLWNIGTLIERLEWTDKLAIAGALDQGLWNRYCSLDIEHFHVEARSLLDYAASCIAAISKQPGTAPATSLNGLLSWINKNPGNTARLGPDLAALVKSLPGFPDLRAVRDEIIHRGGLTLVFGRPGEGLVFQVHKGFARVLNPRSGTVESGLVDFRSYSALLVADILLFLERLAALLWEKMPVKKIGIGDAQLSGPGWDVFLSWLDHAERTLNGRGDR